MVKKISLLLLGTFLFTAIFADTPLTIQTTPAQITPAPLTQAPLSTDNTTSLAAEKLTLPLLTSALSRNYGQYATLLSRILEELNTNADPHFSYQAWILGRVLLAASYMKDSNTADKVANLMLRLLQDNATEHNEYYAWAWAYLVNYYSDQPELYEKYKTEMLNSADYYVTEAPKQLSNIVWARVLEALAAANAKDAVQYEVIVNSIKADTKQKNLLNALNTIPDHDYQAWAKAMLAEAAAKVNDLKTYDAIKPTLEQALAAPSENNNYSLQEGNILAKLTLDLAEQSISKEPPKETQNENAP